MSIYTIRIKSILCASVLALGLAALTQEIAVAQDATTSDSAKQAEAMKAMEAAADSARKAASRPRPGGNRPPVPPQERPNPQQPASTAIDESAAVDATTAPDTSAASQAEGPTTPGAVAADTSARQAEAVPEEPVDPTAPYKNVTFAPGEKPLVVIETSMGKIVVELWPDVAPKHCQNFVYQAGKGFYDSLTIHRVVPGFLIQGGDPTGTGTGGPGYSVPAEFSSKLVHDEGIIAMARKVDPASRNGAPEGPDFINSAGSQFFICLGRAPSLDGKYTIFGEIVEGLDVAHKISQTPAQRERPTTSIYLTKVYVQAKI